MNATVLNVEMFDDCARSNLLWAAELLDIEAAASASNGLRVQASRHAAAAATLRELLLGTDGAYFAEVSAVA